MNPKTSSLPALSRFFAVMVGLALLVGCGSSSTTPPAATPSISLSATSLTFSGQFVGSTSTAQSVTVSNTGTATLNFSGIAASGDFAQTNTCGTGIAASSVCTISVTFTPQAAESYQAALFVYDSASNSPQTSSLLGTGK